MDHAIGKYVSAISTKYDIPRDELEDLWQIVSNGTSFQISYKADKGASAALSEALKAESSEIRSHRRESHSEAKTNTDHGNRVSSARSSMESTKKSQVASSKLKANPESAAAQHAKALNTKHKADTTSRSEKVEKDGAAAASKEKEEVSMDDS